MNKLNPLKNMVLIKEVLEQNKVDGIIIPEVSAMPSKKVVQAIGPDCEHVAVGDVIIASNYVGTDIDDNCKLIEESDISAIIKSKGE